MKDRVGLKVDKDGPSVREADVLEVYDGLSKADQDRFLDLHDGKRQYNKIFRIWKGMLLIERYQHPSDQPTNIQSSERLWR